ncbi:MAG: hypothetical protein EOP04_06045 [Proteobacteria bacterium]|nr:MAG: hypothetical protein EOP04_06045 [Pseudomonadota bacterium]
MQVARGAFIFGTCRNGGMSVSCVLRNTSRGDGGQMNDEVPTMYVGISIYQSGQLVFENLNYGEISSNGYLLVNESDFALGPSGFDEFLLVAICSRETSDEAKYFPQEHQVKYRNDKSKKICTVLYDQIPVPISGKTNPAIVIMAPKVWIGQDTNTFLLFNGLASSSHLTTDQALELFVFSSDGKVIAKTNILKTVNATNSIDLRDVLERSGVKIDSQGKYYTVFGRGGAATYSILTILKNEKSGNLATEHTLSPHYYMSGDRALMRNDVIAFKGWNEVVGENYN